jgi:hypothetical protein
MTIETIETAQIVKVFERKVWIEKDMAGSQHVVIQHQCGQSTPFTYCSFHYDYAYTSNASIHGQANKMALSLGAKEPVEIKHREFKIPEEL